jgi:hypothetical protein
MRDGDFSPLSLTHRQWELLLREKPGGSPAEKAAFEQRAIDELAANRQARELRPRKGQSGIPE